MNKYYRKVPPEMLEKFMLFRQEHPLTKRELEGITWEYIHAGHPSGQPLLLLPGGLGTAESAWRMISGLDHRKYHLLCPSYPAQVSSMTALADGIARLLMLEGMQTTYLVGGAYGSMLAQVFIHCHAEMVSKLVLTDAYPPLPSRVKTVDPTLRLFKWVPLFMVKNMLRTQMTGRLPPDTPAELQLIAAQIRETLDTRLTRQAAMSTYLRMMDFDRQEYSPSDLSAWQGKTLIMLAEDDPTTPVALRDALVALYPGATVHLFKGSGHATGILESGEYIKVIEEFLRDEGNSD